ncbi:hypothetical protein BDV25DRAFT_135050 [Aspergillus avenaceus]|uniref:Uncharacterized protein n=1 Tax=Aspergillus avenaceus TaxID=36643 RepID=A0A5N6U9L0_ASPAV|nr:hypothetical protein BDV25DRAFT_135050 [Aspergillus avenaceus]
MFSLKVPLYFLSLAGVIGSVSATSFNLYAYGDNVGGLPLYYSDGNAVVSPDTPSNATKAAPVAFMKDDNNGLVGNPNQTDTGADPAFTDESLFAPGPYSTDKRMGYTTNATSNEVTNKFVWYGHFVLIEDESGEFTSLYSVKKSSSHDQDGSYDLYWNVTDDEDVVPVTMRSIAPSNA